MPNIEVTETFQRCYEVYNDKLNDEEFEDRCKYYKNLEIVGTPSRYRYYQIVSMGGSRSSKTYSFLQILLLEMVARINLTITVWRATKVECRSNVMNIFLKILISQPEIHSKIIQNKHNSSFIYSPTGSIIIFEGADNMSKVLGSTQDISFFNEITEFSHVVYNHITQRTSMRTLCDYNPSKGFFLEDYRQDKDTVFIHSDFRMNKFCPVPIQKKLLSYEPWERGTYEVVGTEVFYNNKPISISNQPPVNEVNKKNNTIDKYMWLVYGKGIGSEKPNKIFNGWVEISEEEFDSKTDLTSYFGLDFGISVPSALVEVKYNGDDAFYIKPRMYKPVQDVSENIGTWLDLECPDIKSNRSLVVGDSAKEAYITSLINSGFWATGAIKGGGSVDLGISAMQKFQFFVVFDTNLKEEYDNYSWEVDKNGVSRDVPLKKNDHYIDAIRYIVTYLIDYLRIQL